MYYQPTWYDRGDTLTAHISINFTISIVKYEDQIRQQDM